jgi:antitoxin (DNA-binding transcriptional repressor) of toxin-antitoxin stability system
MMKICISKGIWYNIAMATNYGHNMKKTIAAGKFKNVCLQLMDDLSEKNEEIIITKRGIPVAKMIGIKKYVSPYGCMAGSIEIKGDIISPLENEWEVCRDDYDLMKNLKKDEDKDDAK